MAMYKLKVGVHSNEHGVFRAGTDEDTMELTDNEVQALGDRIEPAGETQTDTKDQSNPSVGSTLPEGAIKEGALSGPQPVSNVPSDPAPSDTNATSTSSAAGTPPSASTSSTTSTDYTDLLSNSVPEITKQLAKVTDVSALDAIQEAESKDGQPRVGVLKAIEARRAELQA